MLTEESRRAVEVLTQLSCISLSEVSTGIIGSREYRPQAQAER